MLFFHVQEADIAVGGFTITAERRTVVDFIYPFQEEGIGIIMQKVDKLADKMFRVFSPFEIDSWLATISAVFVAAAVLSLIVKFSPFSRKLHSEVSTSFWVAFSAFLQQGKGLTKSEILKFNLLKLQFINYWNIYVEILIILKHDLYNLDLVSHAN